MLPSLSYNLAETVLRKAIRDMRDTPTRTFRNLVDLGVHLSVYPFQRQFFTAVQDMLTDETSAYYQMLSDLVRTVDTDRLVTFGVNLGYNACTLGARQIRRLEQERHFSVPWALSLELDDSPAALAGCTHILEQGTAMGIHAWVLYVRSSMAPVPALLARFPQCAFLVICAPAQLTPTFLDKNPPSPHVMYAVSWTEGAAAACTRLRRRGCLYALFVAYDRQQAPAMLQTDFLRQAQDLHPAFVFFRAQPDCPDATQKEVYAHIRTIRRQQRYQTVPFDLIGDMQWISGAISHGACAAGFDCQGRLQTGQELTCTGLPNAFTAPLAAILQQAFSDVSAQAKE